MPAEYPLSLRLNDFLSPMAVCLHRTISEPSCGHSDWEWSPEIQHHGINSWSSTHQLAPSSPQWYWTLTIRCVLLYFRPDKAEDSHCNCKATHFWSTDWLSAPKVKPTASRCWRLQIQHKVIYTIHIPPISSADWIPLVVVFTSAVTSVQLQATASAIPAGNASLAVSECWQLGAAATAADEFLCDDSGRPEDVLTSILILSALGKQYKNFTL